MNTPIYDFAKKYSESNAVRFHMPGHKGVDSLLGIEHMDITEFDGADNLWDADGIIAESEANASSLFDAHTFYSTEGSSLCIRAMLFMIKKWAYINNVSPFILAARNAHKTFINAAAILDIDVDWIMPKESDTYESCSIDAKDLEAILERADKKPVAVYITSPDYLGNMPDLKAISEVCHRHKVLLTVDNAHGAYLKFLEPSVHPIDSGADMCCDSAHKTLPALTGAAYLHVAKDNLSAARQFFYKNAKEALALFASTSPSYLILQSLDLTNKYLSECNGCLRLMTEAVKKIKNQLLSIGFELKGTEPLKLTINTAAYGYTGDEIAKILIEQGIFLEYHDKNYIVVMITTNTKTEDLDRLVKVLSTIPRKNALSNTPCMVIKPKQAVKPSEAIYMDSEIIPSVNSVGRILAESAVSCPPCVPIYMAGEEIVAAPDTEYVKVVKNKIKSGHYR